MSSPEPNDVESANAAGTIPGLPHDWPRQATNRIVDLIDKVRLKTSGPAIGIARTVVYGLVVAMLAPVLLILALITLIRGLDEAIPGQVGPIYLVMGAVFTLVGLFLWSRRPRGAAG